MENATGIGYVVYCPARDTYLGRMGEWYTDVRLAQVYAEPRSAKMAIGRLEHGWPVAVVPVTVTVRGIDRETAAQTVGTEAHQTTPAKAPLEAKPEPKQGAKAPARAA